MADMQQIHELVTWLEIEAKMTLLDWRFIHLLRPNGKMGVFYICPPETKAAETPFAKALNALGPPYRVRDFSGQNTAHWQKKKQVLLELESMFKGEGTEFLFRNRMAECDGLEQFHRYLYIVCAA